MSIASELYENVVTVHSTGKPSNDLLAQVYEEVEQYFDSMSFEQQVRLDCGWKERIDRVRGANLRLATWDLESLLTDSARPLIPSSWFLYSDDGSGLYRVKNAPDDYVTRETKMISQRPVVVQMPDSARQVIEGYLRSILSTELATVVSLVRRAIREEYSAVVSLDYYNNRPLGAIGAHKDTTGNSFFVVLHYRNPKPMLGPEFIIDKWPIPAEGGWHEHFRQLRPERRLQAPWKLDRMGRLAWPINLLRDLEQAREDLAIANPENVFQNSTIGPNGMISFVDELIFHMTPLREHRSQDRHYTAFNEVGIAPQQRFDLIPNLPELIRQADLARAGHPVGRRMSGDLSSWTTSVPSATGGASQRQFIRLWISIVPSSWYAAGGNPFL